jgi:hypothetical protein
MSVTADEPLDGGVRRSKERHPITANDEVGLSLAQLTTDLVPRKRIAGVDSPADSEVCRRLFGRVLRLAGEKERRVLRGEGYYLHTMPFRLELLCQPLVERRQPTPEWVGCTDDYYVQRLRHSDCYISQTRLITSFPL